MPQDGAALRYEQMPTCCSIVDIRGYLRREIPLYITINTRFYYTYCISLRNFCGGKQLRVL